MLSHPALKRHEEMAADDCQDPPVTLVFRIPNCPTGSRAERSSHPSKSLNGAHCHPRLRKSGRDPRALIARGTRLFSKLYFFSGVFPEASLAGIASGIGSKYFGTITFVLGETALISFTKNRNASMEDCCEAP